MKGLILHPQEIALDDPRSSCMFRPSASKPFVATPAAIEKFSEPAIIDCLRFLQRKAIATDGLDYLQVFEVDGSSNTRLWFIEDGNGGAITALLPDDY